MKASKGVFSILALISLFFVYGNSFALDQRTHRVINEIIVEGSYGQKIDTYLKENLIIPDGVRSSFNTKKVFELVGDGGYTEDISTIPYVRSFNHFHDPLKPWGQAGFSGPVAILDPLPIRSSILWAQATDQYFGDYSWINARDYFYKALIAQSNTERENNFSYTFRAVGQVMHLIQDASVPAHTRNDGHLLYNYENWVFGVQDKDPVYFDQILSNSTISVDPSLFSTSVDPGATSPIAGLFDSNKYNGTNPDVTIGPVGLTEYTNANFLSEDTRFQDYPYPSYNSVATMDIQIPDPQDAAKIVYRPYYTKARDGDTSFYLLTTQGYLSNYVHTNFDWLSYQIRQFEKPALDEFVYDNYARMLLPRAVAYSSALLQYFFRGQIDAVDAKTTKDASGNITGMTLKVKNNTPGEDMTAVNNSHLVVSYNYKDANGNVVYGKSGDVYLNSNIPPANDMSNDLYKYTFTFSNAIPSDATDKHYMLVYRGKLGVENDAVAGKSFQPKVPLVIDDWESGQNWTAKDQNAKLSLDSASPYEGSEDLKISVEGGPYYIYHNLGLAQSIGNSNSIICTDEMGGPGFSFDHPVEISRIACRFYVSTYDKPYGGFYTTAFRIYEYDGQPGLLLGESDPLDVPCGGYYTAIYNFPASVNIGSGKFKALLANYSPPYETGYYAWSFAGIYTIFNSNNPTPCNFQSYVRSFNPYGHCIGSPSWFFYNMSNYGVDMDIVGKPGDSPIARAIIPKDCSSKNTLKVAIKSGVANNPIDFKFGVSSYDEYKESIQINTENIWEVKSIDISKLTDQQKKELKYFSINWGKDSYNQETGELKPNTIYIDLLEAE
jgi:hypothetical protein